MDGKIQDWEFQEYFETKIDKFHIGKRSGGWQFLWQYQPKYYHDDLQSIKKFLSTGDYEIIDEYGRSFSFDDFINDELDGFLYSGYTHETYMKDHPEEKPIPHQYHDWITSDGLRFVNGEFS